MEDANPKNQSSQKKEGKEMSGYVKYSSIAFQMIATMLLGTFAGIKLDELLGTSPLLTVVLVMLSVAIAMIMVIRKL